MKSTTKPPTPIANAITVRDGRAVAGGMRADGRIEGGSQVKYAVTLSLDARKGANGILQTLHGWLSKDLKQPIAFDALTGNERVSLPNGAALAVRYTDSKSPYLHSIRYTHPDSKLPGRLWITEIGIRADEGQDAIQTSVVLSTHDVSSSPLPPALTTRPRLVGRLLAANAPALTTPGLKVLPLGMEAANDFLKIVLDPKRIAPVVLVSVTPGKGPMLDVEGLLRLVYGIADVYLIEKTVDTWKLADVIGNDVVPWGGGVRIIYPVTTGPYADNVPVQTIRPIDIDDWRIQGDDAVQRVFEMIAIRTARANAGRHITVEYVHEEQIRRRVARERGRHFASVNANTDAVARELQAQLLASITQLQEDISEYEGMLTEREAEIAFKSAELDQLEFANDQLKEELRTATNKVLGLEGSVQQLVDRPDSRHAEMQDDVRASIIAMACRDGRLLDALRTVAHVYCERIVVLASAWKSATDSDGFGHVDKAFGLLNKLAGEYWTSLAAGSPNAQAKGVFTKNEFAARESETVTNNQRGRQRRTFTYKGQPVEMYSHLKIGVKPSAHETLRIHFYWDSEEQIIVIGHCGAHLDFD